MSRLAKKPIIIPAGVTASVAAGAVRVMGPKGEQAVKLLSGVTAETNAGGLMLTNESPSKQARANVGTSWSLITNAIRGVTEGFSKVLDIEGVGYRATMDGDTLVLSLGYVNPVRVPAIPGVKVTTEKNSITISGLNKETVGQVAATIRSLKKPEPYKGKGIRYRGEVIKRKVGKKAAATTT